MALRGSACVLGVALLLLAWSPEGWAQHTRDAAHDSARNTCQYANDGECDEPAAGTGACPPQSDTLDCERQHSCQWAHDGVCDEPGPSAWGRNNRCLAGTDSDDCCPAHAHTAANRLQCTCNANYHVDEATNSCQPGSQMSPANSQRIEQCKADCEDLEELEAIDTCQSECGMCTLCPLAGLALLFFPCMVFGFAHMCCIRDQAKDGRQPVPQAWTICTSLFVTALISLWFPLSQILWVVLPFCMVAPFCMDQCCECFARLSVVGNCLGDV